MEYDQKRIEEAVLALLATFSFDGNRSWKGFDFGVMDALHAQGLIDDPRGQAKSVWLTAQGLEKGNEIADRLFAADGKSS
ncbi:DUF6429 family protein [Phytopseudomonas dryadis]|uniref:DUF6429 domain-containing protein n=1 Tax=Phytopseudomonas dryadis TaxID=2487520 RepID=A0A4Q9RA72_9GAMM|nr:MULTISPECIES: DUF6429 family protein [Pseudomonas]TBU97090.1 hypothetical protein DNK44_02565 [Pseudomonas dryadis]TBV08573.1 hypothetical protein DNK34_04720 [Pseudomonas dryadis]TBV18941.1 hypothetical protein DNK41_06145 [Pseudomonas sp. FRB 230]